MATVIDEENNTNSDEQFQFEKLTKLIELNEEQKLFIADCEIEFSNRYTDDDLDYVNNKIKRDACKKEPPIIENWWSRQSKRRDNNWNRRRRDHDDQEHRYNKRQKRHHEHSRFN